MLKNLEKLEAAGAKVEIKVNKIWIKLVQVYSCNSLLHLINYLLLKRNILKKLWKLIEFINSEFNRSEKLLQ